MKGFCALNAYAKGSRAKMKREMCIRDRDRGIEFEFVANGLAKPETTVRYIRFRSLEHFNPTANPRILLAEISFWGTLVR